MIPDFIEIYDNMLTHEECENIINYINTSKLRKGSFGRVESGNLTVRPDIKDSWEIGENLENPTPINKIIEKALKKSVAEYWLKHPQIKHIRDWGPDLEYNLQKYNPEQGYHKLHCENAGGGSNRMLVWMIYLNTVTDGGGTYFENYDRITDAVEGRCVLWPTYLNHFHKGVVSNTQTKYIATGWFETD